VFVCFCIGSSQQIIQLSAKKSTPRGPAAIVGQRKRPLTTLTPSANPTLSDVNMAANRRIIINFIKYLIERVNQHYPLMLVLEDANYMDDESWELTAELCR
jgi:hypothetical protein